MISAPKSSLTRLRSPMSGGPAGGRPWYSAGRPAAAKYRSNPPGVQSERNRAGAAPSTTKVCGTWRGRKTHDPDRAMIVCSPHRNRSCPSSTQNVSSSRWWMCSGGDVPTGASASTSPYAPPVVSAVAFKVIRLLVNQTASPSSAATARAASVTSTDIVLPFYVETNHLSTRLEFHYGSTVSLPAVAMQDEKPTR